MIMCYCVRDKKCVFDDGLFGDYNNPCSHYNDCSHDPELEMRKYVERCAEQGRTPVLADDNLNIKF